MNDFQEKYIGKTVLVGLTYVDEDDKEKDQIQLHGPIVVVSESTIVFTRSDNGEEFSIPFDEDNLEPSDTEFVYELKSTGEAVTGIDYTSLWRIQTSD